MYPNLDACVQTTDISHKGTGKFAASYVPWPKIARYLRKHAPGWQPFAAPAPDGGIAHAAPDGTYFLLIGFRHPDPEQRDTETIPHAVMDHRMQAKKNPDARDIADAFVRGMCKAAALLFGLGDKLWDKDDPFERESEPRTVDVPQQKPAPKVESPVVPYGDPALAHKALGVCTTAEHMAKWWRRVEVSPFADEERQSLIEAAKEHKAKLQEVEA